MLELEAVLFVFLIIERFQLVNSQLVEFVEILPPLVAASQLRAEVGIGNISAHLGSDIERTHCKNVDAVSGYGSQCRGNALDDSGMHVRAF